MHSFYCEVRTLVKLRLLFVKLHKMTRSWIFFGDVVELVKLFGPISCPKNTSLKSFKQALII